MSKQADFNELRGRIDLITGGFPCQPFSLAGNRKGTEDDRYLFPEMLRAIRYVQPRWVVAENVRGLITQQGGVVFEQVCASMEALGYEVQPFMVPACAVNAPHRRDRVWIVAHAKSHGDSGRSGQKGPAPQRQNGERNAESIEHGGVQAGFVADSECCGGSEIHHQVQSEEPNRERSYGIGDERSPADPAGLGRIEGRIFDGNEREAEAERKPYAADSTQGWWRDFPTESPVCSGDDGLSSRLDAITFPKWREQSIKAYGNAVVPQLVYQIFRTIDDYEKGQ